MKKNELTARQLKTINLILEGNSIESVSKKVKVTRGTIYNWLSQSHFQNRLEQERNAVFKEGLNVLKAATAKAAKTLIELLDSRDNKTRRLAAKDIIGFSFKVAEIQEIQERIERIEEFLAENTNLR